MPRSSWPLSLGGTEETCTVTGYYRTSVFEFPGCHLTSKGPIRPQLITESPGLKAVIVSNLPAYFQKENPKPRHYAIDTSLRAGIECAYRKQTGPHTSRRMFVVIEQDARVQPTTFENGECFMIDEHREGRAIIEGGREGKRALLAVRTVDGAWPSFSPDVQGRNSVLAALKIEQNVCTPHYGVLQLLVLCKRRRSSDLYVAPNNGNPLRWGASDVACRSACFGSQSNQNSVHPCGAKERLRSAPAGSGASGFCSRR